MGEIKAWPKPSGNINPRHPHMIDKAADYGLLNAVAQLEGQWGSIEAYNRLVEHCDRLRAKIARGKAEPPNPNVDASYLRPPIPDRMKNS